MGAKNAQPVEIYVSGKPNDTWVDVNWEFTRMSVKHRFSMQVAQAGLAMQAKDNEFRITIPTGERRVGVEMPRYIEEVHKISEKEYRAMISSIFAIIVKHDLVEEAKTSPAGYAAKRDADFKYPTWRDQRKGYSPKVLRSALLTATAITRPKRAQNPLDWPLAAKPNGAHPPELGVQRHQLELPATGSIVDIVEEFMPTAENPYIDGVQALMNVVDGMRLSLATRMQTLSPTDAARKVYAGYDKMLLQVMRHGDELIAKRVPAEIVVPELNADAQ